MRRIPSGVVQVFGVERERAVDGGAFAGHAGIVGGGSGSDDGCGGLAGERGGDGARGSGVANSHFAEAEKIAAVVGGFVGEFDASFERGVHFGFGHGRTFAEVACALGYAARDQIFGRRERRGYADIHHLEFNAAGAGEGVDGRAAVEEVQNHLRCDGLRISADAFGANTMIGCEEDDAGMACGQIECSTDGGAAVGDFFEASETAGWLGQFELARGGLVDPAGIDGSDFR